MRLNKLNDHEKLITIITIIIVNIIRSIIIVLSSSSLEASHLKICFVAQTVWLSLFSQFYNSF